MDWKKFRQRFTVHLVAAKRTKEDDETKIAMLLATGGDIVIDEYNGKYEEKDKPTFDGVLATLENCFKEGESLHFASHMFKRRVQQPQEPIKALVTELRNMVKSCSYKEPDRMIMDQIIEGVACEETRRELLKKETLTLDEAIKISLMLESSKTQMEAVRKPMAAGSNGNSSAAEGEDTLVNSVTAARRRQR